MFTAVMIKIIIMLFLICNYNATYLCIMIILLNHQSLNSGTGHGLFLLVLTTYKNVHLFNNYTLTYYTHLIVHIIVLISYVYVTA